MTIFGVDWDDLQLEHVEAFLASAGGEPLTWEAKGTELRAEQVTKHTCGFANAIEGGYLLLGFQRDGGAWKATGCAFPGGDPPVWVSNVVRNTLRPRPRVDVRGWPTKGKKRAAAAKAIAERFSALRSAEGLLALAAELRPSFPVERPVPA